MVHNKGPKEVSVEDLKDSNYNWPQEDTLLSTVGLDLPSTVSLGSKVAKRTKPTSNRWLAYRRWYVSTIGLNCRW